MRELPSGTVTFLFTDIEGSTRLLHELGAERYADALAEHRRLLREAFARHRGVEVDTQGDALFVAFATAPEALAAAAEGTAALQGPVHVRMGLHTGTPLVTEEGYVSADVHRAARITAAAHGGQVVVSSSTAPLVDGMQLRDLGEHRFKDLAAAERVYQLGEAQFPPLKSLNATNLPVAASALVGRDRELAELLAMLRDGARLVTLTGPGGSGKTRLGLQLAAELVEHFRGGVFFVPLAGVRQAELVSSTIASTIGIRDFGALHDREALVLVDNYEHLLDAASALTDMLARAPRAKVVATSRAPLRLDGEHEYPVEPLPDDDAVELLTQRARAVRPDFQPDEATREICRRLDGLPLALELAASRLRSLGPSALLERLERRLPLLTGGRRDAPERQRTLRATIEWSYDLLEEGPRHAFARLAVFAGGFSLDAAEAVASASLDDVDALVEASLLRAVGTDRYLMLETIRELAAEHLEASGNADDVRLRHAEFFVELAQSANLNIEAEGPQRHDLVIPEHDNIRAALAWTVGSGRGELGLRLAVLLENFWVAAGDPVEGRRWLEALLPFAPPGPSILHALAVRSLANTVDAGGRMRPDHETSERLYHESAEEFRKLGDEQRMVVSRDRAAMRMAFRGDTARARELIEEGLRFHRRTGFAKAEAVGFARLGYLERQSGSPERALVHYDRALELARETGFTFWEVNTLGDRAEALCELERHEEARRAAGDGLRLARRTGHRVGQIWALGLLARIEGNGGNRGLAGTLWGAVEAHVERTPMLGWEETKEALAAPLLALAGLDFEQGRARGRLLSLDEAIELALESSRA